VSRWLYRVGDAVVATSGTRLGISTVRVGRLTGRDGVTVEAEVSAATLTERSE
jgi:hypothetical protein